MSHSTVTSLLASVALGIGTSYALEAKVLETQKSTGQKIEKVFPAEKSARHIPSPTPIPKFEFPDERGANESPQTIQLSRTGSIYELTEEARNYLRVQYQQPEAFKHLSSSYYLAPHILIHKDDLAKVGKPDIDGSIKATIVYVARRINAKATSSANALLETRGPIGANDISLQIIGIAPPALSPDKAIIHKSNGISTVLSFGSYVSLATITYQYNASHIIHTPYTPGIEVEKTLDEGKKYLDELVEQGKLDMNGIDWWERTPEIHAIAFDVIKTLALTENMDALVLSLPKEISDQEYEKKYHRAMSIFATSREAAYNTRKSTAEAKGVLQITPGALNGYGDPNNPGIRIKYPHPLFSDGGHPLGFDQIISSHRRSFVLAMAHIVRQIDEYKEHYRLAYEWLMGPGQDYLVYFIASGYNSSNIPRASELNKILTQYPKLSPEEVMEKFYLGMKPKDPGQTKSYLIKAQIAWKKIRDGFSKIIPSGVFKNPKNPPK